MRKPAGPAADAPQPDAVPVVPRQADSSEAMASPEVPAADPAEPVPEEPVTGERAVASRRRPPRTSAPPQPGKTPPGWMRPRPAAPPGETGPQSIVPGMEEPAETAEPPAGRRRQPPAVLAEAWALARKNPLEAVSVILLGVGGLILPFPFWLIGGLVALRSRRWDARDKWIALAGPPLVTFAVLLIRAGTSPGNFFSAFYHASQHDVGLSIRAGCVLCAGYLVWRLRRGPRMRSLPPWQRPR